jgi:hypothetical protein
VARLPSFSRNWDVPDEIKSRVNAERIRPNCSKSTTRDARRVPSVVCQLLLQLRITLGTINTAALCHEQTPAVQQTRRNLLDHLIRAREQHGRYLQAERLGGLEIDN